MNALENWFCSTAFWRHVTQARVLPWIISGWTLGDHVLEVGAGPGAATSELRRRTSRVTSLEYDRSLSDGLRAIEGRRGDSIVQGDAAALPFADSSFSSAIAVLVLHHLHSCELQDRAFVEIHRILRPGGHFFAFEIEDGWLQRSIHKNSTFVPLASTSISARLSNAGFSRTTVDFRRGGFAMRATRARDVV
jgi:SAM-dependent methyltransferase